MRRLADQRLRFTVLALAIVGSFCVRAFVRANWEGQPLPFGLTGTSLYATTSVYDAVAKVHKSWAVGVDGDGHPLIMQNTGGDWTVAYREIRLGSTASGQSMALRSISAWLSPTTHKLNLVAAGERGLLLYNEGAGWNLQLQKASQPGERCIDPGTNSLNFIDDSTKYFKISQCMPWTTDTLNSGAVQTLTTLQADGTQGEDRIFSVVGDSTIAGVSAYLRASGTFTDGPYLVWASPYASFFSAVGTAHGVQDLRSITMNDAGGWMVSCNRFSSGGACNALPGKSRLYHFTRSEDGFPNIEDVTPAGFPQNPSAVAFIEEHDVSTNGKLPSHIWVTTDGPDQGKIYHYEYTGAGTGIPSVATPEVNNTLGSRAVLGAFNGITARQEVLGGNLIFNPTYVDDVNNGSQSPAHWFTVAAQRKNRTDSGEDDSAGSPDKRMKLSWPDTTLSQNIRVDGFTYDAGNQPDIPLRNSASFTKDVQLVDFEVDETSGNPGFPDLKSLLAKIPGTSTRAMLRLSGFITIPETGNYDFRVGHTNGARFFLGMTAADFTTPRLDDWQANGVTNTGLINLRTDSGWHGTNVYPFVLEWWNGDPSNNPTSDNPALALEWKIPSSGTWAFIPAASLSHFGNDGTATATQVIDQQLLPGQSVHVTAQVKVQMNDALNALSPRDPRRYQRGWAGLRSSLVGSTNVNTIWSMVNQSASSISSAPKAPSGWQTLDYVMTNTSVDPTSAVTVECLADYGTTSWCGDIQVELVGGISGASRQHVWAVGPGGVLAARHSTNAADGIWALEDTPRIAGLNGIAGDSAQHLWAVGDDDALLRFTGGNIKGWAWVGSDTADQTGGTASNDAVGWISFNCANTSAASPNGTCNDSPFNYGVHLNGPATCDALRCSNDQTRFCTTSTVTADCANESNDGVITGHAWFGATDEKQTMSLGSIENRRDGYCQGEATSGLTADPTGHSQRCAVDADCVGSTGPCVVDSGERTIQCSANPSFPTTQSGTCDDLSCSQNPLACRSIGWLSFERSETGDPPASSIDDFDCVANLCSGTSIACSTNADCPLARFDNVTGKIQGWGRFLTLKDANSTGWVHLGSEELSCSAAVGNPTCQTTDIPTPGYDLCQNCTVTPGATTADDTLQCSLCKAATAQPPNVPVPNVAVGDTCSVCGGTSAALSCQGICQNKFFAPTPQIQSCTSNEQCGSGDLCVGFGHCSTDSTKTCITDSGCGQGECLKVAKVCPVCQSCQRWTSALDQSNGQALGWAWSENFGWVDMSNIRIGNVAWLQTKFGDVYSSKDIGSQTQAKPPVGQYNATYLVQAGGEIINFNSANPILDPKVPYYANVPIIPLAQKDKVNILGRLDYSNIINDRACRTAPGVTCINSKDGIPDFLCTTPPNDLCAFVDGAASSCPTGLCGAKTTGKYGLVTDLATKSLGDTIKFYNSGFSIDLGGKVYFFSGNFELDNHHFMVGKQNGSGLMVIDGDLTLRGNLTYTPNPDATLTEDRQLPSLGVLVTGDLNIEAGVSELHGTFYVLGKVTVHTRQSASLDSQLQVFGAMVAHEFDFRRQFRGTLDQSQPAEVIQYDGRLTANPPPGFQDLAKALPDLKLVTP